MILVLQNSIKHNTGGPRYLRFLQCAGRKTGANWEYRVKFQEFKPKKVVFVFAEPNF